MKKILVISLCLAIQGCAFMFPYEDEFACQRPDNLGKCVSSTQAYEQIKNEDDSAPYLKPASEQNSEDIENQAQYELQRQYQVSESRAGYERYLDSQYLAQAQLIEQPIKPLVNQTEVIEILVLAYPAEQGTRLMGERYINVINNAPKFIFGDYLKPKPVAIENLFDKE